MHAAPRRQLIIPARIYAECVNLGLGAYPLETGGVLLGLSDERNAIITAVVGAGPDAEHRSTWFEPDQAWQEREIARVWNEHDGAIEYLGDWHTHPNGSPAPSRRDRNVLESIARHKQARCDRPVMAIYGIGSRGGVTLGAVRWERGRLRRLRPVLRSELQP